MDLLLCLASNRLHVDQERGFVVLREVEAKLILFSIHADTGRIEHLNTWDCDVTKHEKCIDGRFIVEWGKSGFDGGYQSDRC